MKVTPKNVFILENGKYKEITYNELQKLEQTEKSYTSKRFLPLHGMLMEVTEETYKWYYKDKRRQNYVDECSRKRGDFSYNALDTSVPQEAFRKEYPKSMLFVLPNKQDFGGMSFFIPSAFVGEDTFLYIHILSASKSCIAVLREGVARHKIRYNRRRVGMKNLIE